MAQQDYEEGFRSGRSAWGNIGDLDHAESLAAEAKRSSADAYVGWVREMVEDEEDERRNADYYLGFAMAQIESAERELKKHLAKVKGDPEEWPRTYPASVEATLATVERMRGLLRTPIAKIYANG